MAQITRISVFQTTKVLTIYSFFLTIIFMLIAMFFGFLFSGGRLYFNGETLGFLIGHLFKTTIIGTIMTAIIISICCAVYNFVAARFGGIEYDKDSDDFSVDVFE